MRRGRGKQAITYQGREYRLASGHCSKCPLYSGGLNCRADGHRGTVDCGPPGVALRETLRSRLARWLYEPTPGADESHAATRYGPAPSVAPSRYAPEIVEMPGEAPPVVVFPAKAREGEMYRSDVDNDGRYDASAYARGGVVTPTPEEIAAARLMASDGCTLCAPYCYECPFGKRDIVGCAEDSRSLAIAWLAVHGIPVEEPQS